jgi:hypothetical protein
MYPKRRYTAIRLHTDNPEDHKLNTHYSENIAYINNIPLN